jgi:hypothetical protein
MSPPPARINFQSVNVTLGSKHDHMLLLIVTCLPSHIGLVPEVMRPNSVGHPLSVLVTAVSQSRAPDTRNSKGYSIMGQKPKQKLKS